MVPETAAKVDRIEVRLNEHGQLIDRYGVRIDRLDIDVYGDEARHLRGLLERQGTTEGAVKAIAACQHDMQVRYETTLTVAKVVLAILAATGVGVWWPILAAAFSNIP